MSGKKMTSTDDDVLGFDDELDDDVVNDEPDFEELGQENNFDFDKLAHLESTFTADDAEDLLDEFEQEYQDEFGETKRYRKKAKENNALVSAMPTSLSAPG